MSIYRLPTEEEIASPFLLRQWCERNGVEVEKSEESSETATCPDCCAELRVISPTKLRLVKHRS